MSGPRIPPSAISTRTRSSTTRTCRRPTSTRRRRPTHRASSTRSGSRSSASPRACLMATNQLHHTGVLVTDIDRAAAFYLGAFDGHWLFKPAINRGEAARAVFGGPPGVAFKFCYIGFDSGAIELVEFVDAMPEFAVDP